MSFQADNAETVHYPILRDSYISDGKVQGMHFLVIDPMSNLIKHMFVEKEDLNENYEPKKVNDEDVKLKAYGIEVGSKNVMIVETGVWTKTVFNKEVEIPMRRYRFMLSKK